MSSKVQVYELGKRLQIFLKKVLPYHIHYCNNFEGRERIEAITLKVDDYLNNLHDVVRKEKDSFDEGRSYHKYYCSDDSFTSDLHDCSNVVGENKDMTNRDDRLTFNSIQDSKSSSMAQIDGFVCCGSSTLSSYSDFGNTDWDDCEGTSCSIDSVTDNGFILPARFSKTLISHHSEKITRDYKDSCEETDFNFSSLISHWKAQEEKWKLKSYCN